MSNFPTAAAGIEWAINAKARREAIAHAVEALIAVLDVIDGDPDMEDSEAALSAIDNRGRWIGPTPAGGSWFEDDEPDDEDQEHDGREEEHTHCIHYGIDQIHDRMSEPAAFASVNGIDPRERFVP
jgi:hypothetical protein